MIREMTMVEGELVKQCVSRAQREVASEPSAIALAIAQDEAAAVRAGRTVSYPAAILVSNVHNLDDLCRPLSAAERAEVLDEYRALACQPILQQGGWIARIVDGGILAVFESSAGGAASASDRAMSAALMMVPMARQVQEWLAEHFNQSIPHHFAIGIGIHDGNVEAAMPGRAGANGVFGETVNIAAYVEAKSRQRGWGIAVTREALTRAADVFVTRRAELAADRIGGVPIKIHELCGLVTEVAATQREARVSRALLAATRLNAAALTALRPSPAPVKTDVGSASGTIGSLGEKITGYHILSSLSSNALAPAYVARHQESGSCRVLRLLPLLYERDNGRATRFVESFKAIASIRSPHIARVFAHEVCGDFAYVAMEHFPCGNLRSRMQSGVSPIQAIVFLLQAAAALVAMHEQNVVHLDLNPENIFIREDNAIVLGNFGLASHLRTNFIKTAAGEAFGSLDYLAPEQVSGGYVDHRADLYSIGVMFYEMLEGRSPHAGCKVTDRLIPGFVGSVPRLRPVLADLQPLIARLMAEDPSMRYSDANELLKTIAAWPRPASTIAPQRGSHTTIHQGVNHATVA